jgi:uncharacterized protein with FMN-binding domain
LERQLVIPKRGAIAVGLTAIALVLLISFKTPTDAGTAAANVAPVAGTSGPDIADGSTPSNPSASDGSGTGGSADPAATRTVDGPTVETRYGPVQVTVTLDGSTITEITADQLPGGDRRSEQISSRAEPTLRSQALEKQSASIDGVSGATYTSEAYEQSLQAALDAAGA